MTKSLGLVKGLPAVSGMLESGAIRFTIFTPTYNRRATLERVFSSLEAQTFPHDQFEWLVIDDGSSDGTDEYIRECTEKADFPVRYIWQENGGKHRAWNSGVDHARGELFLFFDSDDRCVDDALARIWHRWDCVADDEKGRVAGVLTRCKYPDGKPVGPPLRGAGRADLAELLLVHRFGGETWMAIRTSVVREYKFPFGPKGKLLPEVTLWHLISKHYPWEILEEPLRIYYAGDEGSPDQLSNLRKLSELAPGLVLSYASLFDNSWRFFSRALAMFARSAVHLSRFSLHARTSPFRQIAALREPGARLLCSVLAPVGVATYGFDKLRKR